LCQGGYNRWFRPHCNDCLGMELMWLRNQMRDMKYFILKLGEKQDVLEEKIGRLLESQSIEVLKDE